MGVFSCQNMRRKKNHESRIVVFVANRLRELGLEYQDIDYNIKDGLIKYLKTILKKLWIWTFNYIVVWKYQSTKNEILIDIICPICSI